MRSLNGAGEITRRTGGPRWYDLFWLFMVSAWLGNYLEVLFVWAESGVVMSRSSLLYGSLSLVWGIGAVLMAVLLAPLARAGLISLFLAGAALGAGFEYLASVATQALCGRVFWDYSHLPLNLGGRTAVLFAFLWGAAGVIWVRWLSPAVLGRLTAVPEGWRRGLAVVAAALLALDVGITAAALVRMNDRKERPADNEVARFLDTWYGDDRLHARYRNMELPGD